MRHKEHFALSEFSSFFTNKLQKKNEKKNYTNDFVHNSKSHSQQMVAFILLWKYSLFNE